MHTALFEVLPPSHHCRRRWFGQLWSATTTDRHADEQARKPITMTRMLHLFLK